MNTPDFEAWDMFVAVAEAGSFAGAAKARNLSVPTVSRAIARLEKKLGATLFNRTSRRLSLSSLGQEALAQAQALVQAAHQMEAKLGEASSVPAGHIKLGAPMEFGLMHVAPLLPDFLRAYPQIDVELDLNDAVVDIVSSGHDVMLRIGRLADSSLIARRLCQVHMHLVASPNYLETYGRPQTPQDLIQKPCILYSNSQPANQWTFIPQNNDGDIVQVQVNGPLKVNSGSSMLPAIKAGLGIGVVPDFLVNPALESGEVVDVFADWKIQPLGLYLVTPPNPLRPSRARLLIDYLVKTLSKQPWQRPD